MGAPLPGKLLGKFPYRDMTKVPTVNRPVNPAYGRMRRPEIATAPPGNPVPAGRASGVGAPGLGRRHRSRT